MIHSFRLVVLTIASLLIALASAAEDAPASDAYLLFNVEANGPLSVRDIAFTNLETGRVIVVRDVIDLGRYTGTRYLLTELPAGSYYLSAIYPSYNRNDASPPIEISEEGGIITVLADTINYIGDILVETRDMGVRISANFTYEPNSRTMIHAATSERELFERLPTVVTIAGHYPVPVERRLLGL